MNWRKLWRHPLFWLGLMVTAFFAVSLYSGVVAYYNFNTHNTTDTGIITQAVSSTTFGRQAPYYESYDCFVKDRCSLLLVHPGFVLYVAVPFYALAPSVLTLFALRSFFVALAAVPLYWLTRQVTKSQGQGLLAASLYLIWAPTLSGDAFSLHLESLLPFELLSLAALWQAGRYRWGLLAALAAFLTLEIAPIFVFLIGLFFLVPFGVRWLRRRWAALRMRNPPGPAANPQKTRWTEAIRVAVRSRELRYTLLLMGSSLVAYVLLYSFMNIWGSGILGVSAPSVPSGLSGVFYNSSTGPTESISGILQSPLTVTTAEYWLILYGFLAFLPLLSPRALVISVPWIGFTFLTEGGRTYATTLGQHGTMIAAGPIFIGLAYGFRRIPFDRLRRAPSRAEATGNSSAGATAATIPPARRRSRAASYSLTSVFVVIVIVNVLFSPINPLLPDEGIRPGAPFASDYFNNQLTVTAGLSWAEQMIAGVPLGASIAASPALFPLVATHPRAIVIEPGAQPFADPKAMSHLPFNMNDGPQYVFLEQFMLATLEKAFAQNLSNPALYGLRGYVGSTSVGALLLYEQYYTSPAVVYGPTPAGLTASYWPGHGLSAGPIGKTENNASAIKGKMIRSIPGTKVTGVVWSASSSFLAPGSYVLDLEVSATGSTLRLDPGATVFGFVGNGTGVNLVNETFPGSAFVSGAWTNLTIDFTAVGLFESVSWQGFLLDTNVSIAAAYLSIQPTGVG